MDTSHVKKLYNQSVGGSPTSYEYSRWGESSQKKASYYNTRRALEKNVLSRFTNCTSILEVGPGPGTWTKLLLGINPNASYDLVDISVEMLKQAKNNLADFPNVNFIESDILEFSSTTSYDGFFSSRIIEYVPDKAKAIAIITDRLRPGAVGFISTKTPQSNRLINLRKMSELHRKQITAPELVHLLEQHHCTVVEVINITSVFPLLQSGTLDRILTRVSAWLPFSLTKYWSESYGIIFTKQ